MTLTLTSFISKVVARTDRHTNRQTDRHTHTEDENITFTACAGDKNVKHEITGLYPF